MEFNDDFYKDLVSKFDSSLITFSLNECHVEIITDVWFRPHIDDLVDVCREHGGTFYIEPVDSTTLRAIIHPVVFDQSAFDSPGDD